MPSDRGAAAQRDAGLRRVSRLTRWLLAGALALTAGFSTIAARTFSGTSRARHAASTTTSTTNDDSSQSGTSGSDDSSSALQAPSSPPSASGGSGSVTSGGS